MLAGCVCQQAVSMSVQVCKSVHLIALVLGPAHGLWCQWQHSHMSITVHMSHLLQSLFAVSTLQVVSCLSDNKASIKAEACRKEVTYLEKLEVNDFRTDMVLAEACRVDVNKFCAAVEPGEGRVHKCLRDHAAQVTPQCR